LKFFGLKLWLVGTILVFGAIQSKALADDVFDTLRSELSLIGSQVEDLRLGLLSPEVRSLPPFDAGIALLRLDALEAKLRSTVGRVEALEFNLQILSEDANNRILQFQLKLSEFEGDTKLSKGVSNTKINKIREKETQLNDLSNETLVFDKAILSFNSNDFQTAEEHFNSFQELYPDSRNIAEAHYWLGRSKFELDDTKGSANSFLEAFSLEPNGHFAWRSLLGLAMSLGELGQIEQGCLTLEELKSRFPEKVEENLDQVLRAEEQMKCSA
jgi:tol-pal system protein YbgF